MPFNIYGQQQAQPPTTDSQPASGPSQIEQWLSNPVNQAGLLSFGLQAMAGGWGSGLQQLSGAFGAGIEGAAGAAKIQQEQERFDQKRGDVLSEQGLDREDKRLDRASRERQTDKIIAGRENVANLGTFRAQNLAEKRSYDAYKAKVLQILSVGVGNDFTQEELDVQADQAATRHMLQRQEQGLSGGGAPTTSTIPAPTSGQGVVPQAEEGPETTSKTPTTKRRPLSTVDPEELKGLLRLPGRKGDFSLRKFGYPQLEIDTERRKHNLY